MLFERGETIHLPRPYTEFPWYSQWSWAWYMIIMIWYHGLYEVQWGCTVVSRAFSLAASCCRIRSKQQDQRKTHVLCHKKYKKKEQTMTNAYYVPVISEKCLCVKTGYPPLSYSKMYSFYKGKENQLADLGWFSSILFSESHTFRPLRNLWKAAFIWMSDNQLGRHWAWWQGVSDFLLHPQWGIHFKSAIPNVRKAMLGLSLLCIYLNYYLYVVSIYIYITYHHYCCGYFSTPQEERRNKRPQSPAAGNMLYHWATLTRPAFSLDAKMRMEPWSFWWLWYGLLHRQQT